MIYSFIYGYTKIYIYRLLFIKMVTRAFRVFTDCSETGLKVASPQRVDSMGNNCSTPCFSFFLQVIGLFSRLFQTFDIVTPHPWGKITYLTH